MTIEGDIDSNNTLWVKLDVIGEAGKKTMPVFIDTGFSGELAIPLQIAVPLGLKLSGAATSRLADGAEIRQMLFSAKISWGTQKRPVTVHVMPGDVNASIGCALLHGYVLHADFENKQLIIKEPHVDEPTKPNNKMG